MKFGILFDLLDHFSMISLEQWRAAIGSFASYKLFKTCTIMKCKDDVSHAECIMCLIVYATIVGMLLIVSDNEDHGQNPRKYASHFACI